MFSMFRGYFYIGQHDCTEAVHARHQRRRIAFMGCIKVKDISTGQCHGLAKPRRRQTVAHGQIRYELAPQMLNLGNGKPNIAGRQLSADFLRGMMPLQQGPAHKDQDIKPTLQ